MSNLLTRASSINRALDEVGDKWCLLIIQDVFWGFNSFNKMMRNLGVSRGVLADRLRWLQRVKCLEKVGDDAGGKRMRYRLTPKALELYHPALMAMLWERQFFATPNLDDITLVHMNCGKSFTPIMCCSICDLAVQHRHASYGPGPGETQDERKMKVRRRSSIPIDNVPSEHGLYRQIVNIIGDRWTSNVVALSFHGFTRFEQFHRELPVATNILSDRLKFLVEQKVFKQRAYQQRPQRHEYILTPRGEALYPYFLALLQWGDKWCDATGAGKPIVVQHESCGQQLEAEVRCDQCQGVLNAKEVRFKRIDEADTSQGHQLLHG